MILEKENYDKELLIQKQQAEINEINTDKQNHVQYIKNME